MQSRRVLRAPRWISIPPASRAAVLAVLLAVPVLIAGCGMPGTPQPPSLNLPNRVTDLSAVRTGGQVALTWTMPTKNTDKLLLKGNITVRICRNQPSASRCSMAATLHLTPGVNGAFTDTLPDTLAENAPRPLIYFIQLDNRKGRTAGLSNPAEVLAGEAPTAVLGLSAEMRRQGVLLQWNFAPAGAAPAAIRLERTLLTPPARNSKQGSLAQPVEPLQQSLLVEADAHPDRALDTSIHFGETYEYRAQRIARATINGKTMELAGPLSAPVRIDAINKFPPAVPRGLAVVATAGENGAAPAIDLNWQPNTEADLAGYIVYRREVNANGASTAWRRISPEQPVVGPGYHDAGVEPGHAYAYSVSAVDQQGHESARSAEAQEAVPAQ